MVRIQKSMKRAEDRRRAKGIIDSPSAVASPGGEDGDEPGTPHPIGTGKRGGRKKVNPEGTGRRCANCGQIGHIKTNKKSVPLSPSHDTQKHWVCAQCEEQARANVGFGFVGEEHKFPQARRRRVAADKKNGQTADDARRDSLTGH